MKKLKYLMIAAAMGVTACVTPVATGDRASDVDVLRQMKLETWPGIYDRMDADALDAFLSDAFVMIDNDGRTVTKEDELTWMRSTEAWSGADDFVYTIDDIVFLGTDGAIVYGRGQSTSKTEIGDPCVHTYASSNIFRREDGQWRPVMSHVSGSRCDVIT